MAAPPAGMWLIVASLRPFICFVFLSLSFPRLLRDSAGVVCGLLSHGPQDRRAGLAPRLGHGAPHPLAPSPPPHPVLPSGPHLLLAAAAAPAPPGEPSQNVGVSSPRATACIYLQCVRLPLCVLQFNMEQRRREQEQHEKQQELQQLKHKDKSQQSE